MSDPSIDNQDNQPANNGDWVAPPKDKKRLFSTKNKTKKDETSVKITEGSTGLKKKPKLSITLLAVVVLSVVITGAYLLYRSFAAEPVLSTAITVDANKVTGEVNPLLFGSNFHSAAGGYKDGFGIWNPTINPSTNKPYGTDPKMVSAAKNIDMKVVRWPGGTGVSAFNWKEWIGPVASRPYDGCIKYTDATNTVCAEYKIRSFGLPEFLKVTQDIGATPTIEISEYIGTAQDAADLVQYLNSPADAQHPWAQKREIDLANIGAISGKIGVKFFEYGNETNLNLGIPCKCGETIYPTCPTVCTTKMPALAAQNYIDNYFQYKAAMVAVDSSIKFGAVVAGNQSVWTLQKDSSGNIIPDTDWDHTLLTNDNNGSKKIDYLVYHAYIPYYETHASRCDNLPATIPDPADSTKTITNSAYCDSTVLNPKIPDPNKQNKANCELNNPTTCNQGCDDTSSYYNGPNNVKRARCYKGSDWRYISDAKTVFNFSLGAGLAEQEEISMLNAKSTKFSSANSKGLTQRDTPIPIAITEYNGGFVQSEGLQKPYRHTLGNALVNADLFATMMQPGNNVMFANQFQYPNSYWGMIFDERRDDTTKWQTVKLDNIIKRPNYYTYDLYANHFGTKLIASTTDASEVNGTSYTTSSPYLNIAGSWSSPTSYTVPYLAVNASKSTDGNTLYLMVINKDQDKARPSTINLSGSSGNNAKAFTLNAKDANGNILPIETTNALDPTNPAIPEPNVKISSPIAVPVNGSSFTYTFEPHSLTAIEITRTNNIAITTPTGTQSYAKNSIVPVSWTGLAGGEYNVWLRSKDAKGADHWDDKSKMAGGETTTHSASITLSEDLASGYQVVIGWRPVSGSGDWTSYGSQTGSFSITDPTAQPAPVISITAPSGTGSYTNGANIGVNWTTSTKATGEYYIWLHKDSLWFSKGNLLATGLTSYIKSISLNEPQGTGYQVVMAWRPVAGTGNWTAWSTQNGSFAIANGTINITAPTGTASYTKGSTLTTNWTSDLTGGQYNIWVRSKDASNNDLWSNKGTVDGSLKTKNITLTENPGSGYQIVLGWRATIDTGAWTSWGTQTGAFTITPATEGTTLALTLNHIDLTPNTTQTIKTGKTIQFKASGQDSSHKAISGLTYTWTNTTTTGLFNNKTVGTYTVKVTSGGKTSNTVTVKVTK